MKRLYCILSCILLAICCASMQNIAYADTGEVDFSCKSALLMDYSSGQVLFEKEGLKHLPVASMVKMMTILLTLEEIDSGNLTLDTPITTSENASGMGGSQVFIDPFVEYRTEELLKSVIMASANDASVALAEHICGSEKAFVAKMNARAKELGMFDTNYSNCTGLPAPEQYSCAKDCATLLKEVVGHEIYHNYSTIWTDELVHPSGRKTELVNTNRLIRLYDGCDSGKTGSTNEAGCCLSASAKRGNMRLISVVVGAPNSQSRFNECSSLFNYGFANFVNKEIVGREALKTLEVSKGKQREVELFAKDSFSVVLKKGEEGNFDTTFILPKKVAAPVKSGDKVGSVVVSKDGNVLSEIDVIVKTDIEKLGYKDCLDRIVEKW